MDFGALLRYWALTLAVFVFFIFALIVVGVDVFEGLRETARKRRAERKPIALDPNPLAAKSIAGTILPGPGQLVEGRREWVARAAEEIVRKVNPRPPVQTLVLEDSKGHPLVHFSNGTRLESYRFDRSQVDAAVAGDATKISELVERLTRHLTADFLGTEDVRPRRTTELAREAAPKAAVAAKTEAGAPPAPAAAEEAPAAAPARAPDAPAKPSAPAPAAPSGADPESMSREERLAAAKAKADALRAARQPKKSSPE